MDSCCSSVSERPIEKRSAEPCLIYTDWVFTLPSPYPLPSGFTVPLVLSTDPSAMPKVVSRSAASTSNARTGSDGRPLRVYYCLCGEFILVSDKRLVGFPQRKTDDAYVMRSKGPGAPIFKFNVNEGGRLFVKRLNGLELQYRFVCPRCELLVAYQTQSAPLGQADYVYCVYGALSELQGRPGDAAFEGEDVEGGKMRKVTS